MAFGATVNGPNNWYQSSWLKNFCYNPNLRVLCKVVAIDMHVGSEALQGMEHMLQVFFCRFWPLGYQDLLGILQI